MTATNPLQTLLGYRLGSSMATTELQSSTSPAIHIDFKVLKLGDEARNQRGAAIILTGTAGDGKTYLAYRIIDALGVDRGEVLSAQHSNEYSGEAIFIDLDLSAGGLDQVRVDRLYQALASPGRL